MKKLSDEELIRNADIFIQGEVVKTQSYFEGIRIMSEISFKSKQDKIYQIKIDGGIIGDVGAFNKQMWMMALASWLLKAWLLKATSSPTIEVSSKIK